MNVDFNQIIQRFERGEDLFLADKVRIRIPNAEQRLRGGLDYFVKDTPLARNLMQNG